MIKVRGQALLLPVSPWFIVWSLVFALLLSMWLGLSHQLWLPDVLAIFVFFWGIHQPRRVGMGIAFFLGLWVDVQQSALLGQHALAYTFLSYGAFTIHRRLLWFALPQQALQVLPFFVLANVTQWLTRLIAGEAFAGWLILFAPLCEALLWPLVSTLLLAPQRRAHETDVHRPI
ncbi:MAG: rod shape-determining protein MreD [Betaproteobacteria bacterium]|jgi:rod shape-determining protein MreD|nr:rod shape-determining protein MreD [Burkholderiales bacterium]NBX91248.1 rod shape-determining protein MreD [Betaproteobacteria bacterium]